MKRYRFGYRQRWVRRPNLPIDKYENHCYYFFIEKHSFLSIWNIFSFNRVLNFLLNIFLNVLLNFLLYFIFVFSKLCLLFFKNDITKSFRLSSYRASAFACFGERANLFLGDRKFFLASLVAEKLQIDMLKSIRQWTTVLQNK